MKRREERECMENGWMKKLFTGLKRARYEYYKGLVIRNGKCLDVALVLAFHDLLKDQCMEWFYKKEI